MNEEETTQNARSEWISFGVFVAVLVIVMLVVALSRPYIFGRVVPAIMGAGQPTVQEPAPEPETAPETEPPAEEEPAAEVETPTEETSTEPYPAAETEDSTETDGETAADTPTGTDEEEAAADQPTTDQPATEEEAAADTRVRDNSFTYTVRPGDTLYEIARRYATTPEEIIAATDTLNSLDEVIIPGMEIVIPRR